MRGSHNRHFQSFRRTGEGTILPRLFSSFWMAGFESACHINSLGQRLDMIAAVQHDSEADHDYGLIRQMGMRSARDGVRWHLIDRGGRYDFASLLPLADAAQQHGVQVVWNILHYGWPEDLDIFSPQFVDRFGKFAGAMARFFADRSDQVPFYAPVNEISFFSWAASRDCMYPFAWGRDGELKRQLVRAAIAACEAVWAGRPARALRLSRADHQLCSPIRSA